MKKQMREQYCVIQETFINGKEEGRIYLLNDKMKRYFRTYEEAKELKERYERKTKSNVTAIGNSGLGIQIDYGKDKFEYKFTIMKRYVTEWEII